MSNSKFNQGPTHHLYEVIEIGKDVEPWMKPMKVGDVFASKDKMEGNRRQLLNKASTDIVTVEKLKYHGRVVRPTKQELNDKLRELKDKIQKRRKTEK